MSDINGMPHWLVDPVQKAGFNLGTAPGWTFASAEKVKSDIFACSHPAPVHSQDGKPVVPSLETHTNVKLKVFYEKDGQEYLAGVCSVCSHHWWSSRKTGGA